MKWHTAGKRVYFESDDGEKKFSVLADDSLLQRKVGGSPVLLLAEFEGDFVRDMLDIVQDFLVKADAQRFSDVFRLGKEGVL